MSPVRTRYRESPARDKLRQIRSDAPTFDFSPNDGQIAFVFVDAAHDYPHGLCDSRTELGLVCPGGTIVWHDFEPYSSGLMQAIREATRGMRLRRLAGTSMAVLGVAAAERSSAGGVASSCRAELRLAPAACHIWRKRQRPARRFCEHRGWNR